MRLTSHSSEYVLQVKASTIFTTDSSKFSTFCDNFLSSFQSGGVGKAGTDIQALGPCLRTLPP